MIKSIDYGFYKVDYEYIKFLHSYDSEVYFNSSYKDKSKPFLGIMVGMNGLNYFIPLSSAKAKHKKWKNVSREHFLIYEIIDTTINIEGDIYKSYSKDKKMHILGLLDIKKMIPVPQGYFEKIVFDNLNDFRYQDLFKKEYAFCLKIKDKVLSRVENIYNRQKETGEVKTMYCNFSVCEKAMLEWLKDKK